MFLVLLVFLQFTLTDNQGPFVLTANGDFSSAFEMLLTLDESGEISRDEMLLFARLNLLKGQTDEAISIFNYLSEGEDACAFLSIKEMKIWQIDSFFSKDTIYILDSIHNNCIVRNMKIFIKPASGIFYIDFNPFYTYVEIKKAYSDSMSSQGGFFLQKMTETNPDIGWVTRLNFIPGRTGSYVVFRIIYLDLTFPEKIEIEDDRLIIYEAVKSNYSIVYEHYNKNDDLYIGSINFHDISIDRWFCKNPWLVLSPFRSWQEISDTIGIRMKLNENQNLQFSENLISQPFFLYLWLKNNISLSPISTVKSHFITRPLNRCIEYHNATELEIAAILYYVLKDDYEAKILFCCSDKADIKYSEIPSFYFDRIFILLPEDSIWIDPRLSSPYGYLPGDMQNSPALNITDRKLDTLPLLSPERSFCRIFHEINIENDQILYKLNMLFTGEFYLNIIREHKNEIFFKDKIISFFNYAEIKNIDEHLFGDSCSVVVEFSYPKIPYDENICLVRLFKPIFLFEELYPQIMSDNYIFNNLFCVEQRIQVDDYRFLINETSEEISKSWCILSSNISENTNYSRFTLTQDKLPLWKRDELLSVFQSVDKYIFPDLLLLEVK